MPGIDNDNNPESHLEVVEVQDPKTWEWKKVLTEVQIRNVLEEWKPWNPDDQDVKVELVTTDDQDVKVELVTTDDQDVKVVDATEGDKDVEVVGVIRGPDGDPIRKAKKIDSDDLDSDGEVFDVTVFVPKKKVVNKNRVNPNSQEDTLYKYDPTEQGITDENNLIEANNLAAQQRLLDQGYGSDPSWTSSDVDQTFDVGGF